MVNLSKSKLVESSEIVNKDGIPLEKQKEISNELVEEKYFEFQNFEGKINPNNLIHRYKTEGFF